MKKSIKKGFAVAAAVLAVSLSSVAIGKTVDREKAQASYAGEAVIPTAVLRQGSKGGEVKEVQRRLKLWGYYKGSVDGVFGAGTRSAIIAFQKKNGLTADGVVGKATYKALGMSSSYQALVDKTSNNAGSTNGFSSSDVYLLARTISMTG